ncbi:SNARE associated Golgi protein [Synechococcus sp. PCC 7335]|uniref:TVP38/TMEM64 family protein n=1 Tax=Synechococcus sp. (strain ATCC 29403 / PCC 7335) TaxID=91464 RepID=UPI00017EB0CE|nr:TVP38/TMEM64 family protein [Synechococcus sp. PCC 7335]EDX85414.1 SNARE associated Golgi protein [Synechococcus sp. PCC 7335]
MRVVHKPIQGSVERSVQKFRIHRLWKWIALGIFGSLLFSAMPALAQEGGGGPFAFIGQIQQWLVSVVEWIDGLGAIAPIVFVLAYILVTVAFLPASVITLGAGFVFGVVKGSILVFIGAMLGATAAFLVGRFIARDWIAKKVEDKKFFKALDTAIADEGLKLIFLIRLSPAFPFNLLNYALGLTKVSLRDYVLGTTGIIPGTIMYVYLGSLIGDVAMLGTGEAPANPFIDWTIKILIFVTVVAISLYIAKIAKKALNASVPETEEASTDMA